MLDGSPNSVRQRFLTNSLWAVLLAVVIGVGVGVAVGGGIAILIVTVVTVTLTGLSIVIARIIVNHSIKR
jgi:uncharacterized membrane protein